VLHAYVKDVVATVQGMVRRYSYYKEKIDKNEPFNVQVPHLAQVRLSDGQNTFLCTRLVLLFPTPPSLSLFPALASSGRNLEFVALLLGY